MSGRIDLLGGMSPIMVASHIRAKTAAVQTTRRSRRRERLAWMAAGALLATSVIFSAWMLVTR